MKNNTVLHYKKGTSDKVYVVSITEAGSAFEVTAHNGRIYKKMQTHDKGVFNSRSQAETQAQSIIASKKKKGYVEIESVAYDGPLTPRDSWLKTWLAPEPRSDAEDLFTPDDLPDLDDGFFDEEPPEKPATSVKDWEVVCVNALGMEDSFDEGVTYIAEAHSDDDMLYVWDRNGEKRECFKERFEKSA